MLSMGHTDDHKTKACYFMAYGAFAHKVQYSQYMTQVYERPEVASLLITTSIITECDIEVGDSWFSVETHSNDV